MHQASPGNSAATILVRMFAFCSCGSLPSVVTAAVVVFVVVDVVVAAAALWLLYRYPGPCAGAKRLPFSNHRHPCSGAGACDRVIVADPRLQ